jgi:hypothetical protein
MCGAARHSRLETGDVVALCSRAEPIKKYIHYKEVARKEGKLIVF